MPNVRVILSVGLGLLGLAAIVVLLSTSTPTVLATNQVIPHGRLAINTKTGGDACQSGELVPRGTRQIRLSLEAFIGPALQVTVLSKGHIVTSGKIGAGWGTRYITVPVRPVPRTISSATVCFKTGRLKEVVSVLLRPAGRSESARTTNERLGGRLGIEYLGRQHSSWLAMIAPVVRHMGLGRAWPGSWVAPVVALLMLAATTLAYRLLVSETHE